MQPSLAIGDFARATHLSVKTLRHYHRIGLLEPAAVDPVTGYRRYRAAATMNADGRLQTGSLMDYALPSAVTLPRIEAVMVEVPAPEGP